MHRNVGDLEIENGAKTRRCRGKSSERQFHRVGLGDSKRRLLGL